VEALLGRAARPLRLGALPDPGVRQRVAMLIGG
jgi:hypothetical protein